MAKKLDSLSSKSKTEVAPAAESPAVAATPPIQEAAAAPVTPEEPKAEAGETSTALVAESQPDTYDSLFPEPSVSITSPPRWILWLILLIASMAIAFLGYKTYNGKIDGWLSTESTPTPSATAEATAVPTDEPTETATPSAEATATPTPDATATPAATATPTPSATPAGAITKSAIKLRVLNGTSKEGAASVAKTTLEKDGFTVRTIGNAKTQTYKTTMVYYTAGHKAEADLVKASLSAYETTVEESTLASPDSVLVVIGLK